MKRAAAKAVPYHMQSPVLLAQPVLNHVLSIFLGSLLILTILFCALTRYSHTEAARGEIAAASGFSALVAEGSGVIGDVMVHPGQRVARGQALAHLTPPPVVIAGGETSALSIEQARAALHNIDLQLVGNGQAVAAAHEQIARIRQGATVSSGAAGARRSLTEQRKQIALTRLRGLEDLAGEGIVTQMAVDQARVQSMQLFQEATDADLTINEIGRGRDERVAALHSRIQDLRQNALTLRTERLQIEKQMVELRARQVQTIVAPNAGIVAAVSIRPGQRIEIGQRMLAIAKPDTRLTAILEVPSKAIGLIEPGQRVSLKYDAFPYETYGLRYGRVTRVGAASLDGGQSISSAGQEIDRKFLVEIAPEEAFVTAYGRKRPLRVGMMLTADIEVERRSILTWWLSPFLSLTGRLT